MPGQQAKGCGVRADQLRQRRAGWRASRAMPCADRRKQFGVTGQTAATGMTSRTFCRHTGQSLGRGQEAGLCQRLGRDNRPEGEKGLKVDQIPAGMGQRPNTRTVQQAALHGRRGCQSLKMIQPRQQGLPRWGSPAQGRSSGQCESDAGKGARAAHTGNTAKARRCDAQQAAYPLQGRGQYLGGAVTASPALGAEQDSVLRNQHLQRAFCGIEDEFQPGGIRPHSTLPLAYGFAASR